MTKWVRVKDKMTGHEYTVARVNESLHEVLEDKPATSKNGRPLPPKYHVKKDGTAAPAENKETTDTSATSAAKKTAEAKK